MIGGVIVALTEPVGAFRGASEGRRSAEVEVRYQLKPIELGEADLADVRICNEYDESVVTFTFPDSHEAYIARALMIRAFAKAVLIIPHTSVVRENRNPADEVIAELNRLSSQLNDGAPRLAQSGPQRPASS